MSAFSFTAPFISEEDEKAERLALSEEEKINLHLDIYGHCNNNKYNNVENNINSPSQEGNENICLLLQKLNEALIDLPINVKKDYVDAVEQVPNLVLLESNPLLFLEYENYNPIEAAKRMVHYWKLRKEVFGIERVYLPMTLKGAMSKDIDVVHKGLIHILPNDSNGRSVVFWDRIRAIKTVITREEIERITFYIFHIIAHRKSKSERSYLVLVCLKGYDLYMHFDRILSKRLSKLMQGMPVHNVAIHSYTGSGKSVLSLVLPTLKQLFGKEFRLRYFLHAGSDKEILERLALYGVTGDHLEQFVNGSYKRDNICTNWLLKQEILEESKTQTLLQQI